jgi:peptidyl-prolyl cis-trans isomerase C
MQDKVMARVNGAEILESKVQHYLKGFGNDVQFTEKHYKQVIDELVYQEMFYFDAIENGLDKDKAFLDRVEAAMKEVLKEYAINKLIDSIEVTEEEIKEFYETQKNQLISDGEVRAAHILVKEEDKIKEIEKEIQDGKEFAKAAEEYSMCPSCAKEGDLGFFKRGQMVKEFEEKAFSMEVGQVSEPVKTQFGYHLIKVLDKKEGEDKTYEQLKPEMEKAVLFQKQNMAYFNKTQEMKKKYEVEYL